jgi:hypothetical protein
MMVKLFGSSVFSSKKLESQIKSIIPSSIGEGEEDDIPLLSSDDETCKV